MAIVCYSKKIRSRIHVDGIINKDDFTGQWYLIGFGTGYEKTFLLVKSSSGGDALDEYADNDKWKHLSLIPEDEKDDYLQDGRLKIKNQLNALKERINETINELYNPELQLDFFKREHLNELDNSVYDLREHIKEIIKDALNNPRSLEIDSNGPYDCDRVMYLGNESDMHMSDHLYHLERIPDDQIDFFMPKAFIDNRVHWDMPINNS